MAADLIPSFIAYAQRQGDAGVDLLEAWHDQAVADLLEGGGVALTSLSYPGASASGAVQVPTAQLLPALARALSQLRGERPAPRGSHIDFRAMPYGT